MVVLIMDKLNLHRNSLEVNSGEPVSPAQADETTYSFVWLVEAVVRLTQKYPRGTRTNW